MPLPKLSPLQSRLAASLAASCMLLILYFVLSLPQFAYAADVGSITPEDHNHERLLDSSFLMDDYEVLESEYIPEFSRIDRGIIGRQVTADDPTPLLNNVLRETNVEQGKLLSYVFTKESLYGDQSPETPGLPSPVGEQVVRRSEDQAPEENAELVLGDDDETAGDDLILRTRQSASQNRTLYITVTTCLQPQPISNTTIALPPQLKLYVSNSSNNTKPGPSQNSAKQQVIVLQGGYGMLALNATDDVFFGVYGENTTNYKNVWSAQIAASIDAPFHTYNNDSDPNLFMVDSDSSSALLVTDNLISDGDANTTDLYDKWMNLAPPFVIFATPVNDSNLKGLERSYCAWGKYSQIGASTPGDVSPSKVQRGMTSRGVQNLPKEQFYMDELTPGTVYNAVLAMNGNSTDSGEGVVGGGGQVFPLMNFTTMQGGNCGVVFNLSFCSDSAYAVPSNPNIFPNMSSLAAFYDNSTQAYYENFKKVLAQTPCDTTSSSKYSLVRSCDDCEIAYKRWLCAVTIPRCTDYSSQYQWVVPRAMSQPFPNGTFLPDDERSVTQPFMRNSRNPMIDEMVKPGPYKEVLPCDDLCYDVVQSCPASMQFACPLRGDMGFNQSYGTRPLGTEGVVSKSTQITCNYPGAAYFLAAGQRVTPSKILGVLLIIMAGLMSI